MSDRQVCPICGLTLHNCNHSIEEMIEFANDQLRGCRGEFYDVLKERDALRAELEGERKAHASWKNGAGHWIIKCNEMEQEIISLRAKLEDYKSFHPRAIKLLDKHKNFLVVAEDEPYFLDVYGVIRGDAITEDKWTVEDEERYQKARQKLEEK